MITLEELKTRCENEGFKYSYGTFKEEVSVPFLVAIGQDTDTFGADDIVYFSTTEIVLVLVYEEKNIENENKIEKNILKDVYWRKSDEEYLKDEKVWQICYYFKILNNGGN